jgi:hypothetical protein
MFELDYNGNRLSIQEHTVAKRSVFRISFSDTRAPLVITQATNFEGLPFWTSVPEGRQKEAEQIGTLILEHLNTKH